MNEAIPHLVCLLEKSAEILGKIDARSVFKHLNQRSNTGVNYAVCIFCRVELTWVNLYEARSLHAGKEKLKECSQRAERSKR